MSLTAKGLNFVEFKSEELNEKHAVTTWNLGTIWHSLKDGGFGNLCRDDRSQDLPDAR
jgi:hypothetical protein